MGDRPILTLKKKAAVPVAPELEPMLSPEQLAKAARILEAERVHREKTAAIEAVKPVFEAYFQSLQVVQKKKPLAVKILYVFLAWLREQPIAAGFTGSMLRRTVEPVIAAHVKHQDYLLAVVNEPNRYNIDGSLADPIDEQHKAGAAKNLAKIEKKNKPRTV